MSIVDAPPWEPMVGDPDDHRPHTRWRLLVDAADAEGRVNDLAVIVEDIGVGDRIPLHTHDVSEVVVVLEGDAEALLGDERRRVTVGSAIFVAAGMPHQTINVGATPLRILAAFPATQVELQYLERNPAPGTEGDAPRRIRFDLRTGEMAET